jgi:hypothetical protein
MELQAYVSPREAAQMMDMRLDAVYSLLWAKRLQAEKRDGRWQVSRSAVEARMESRRNQKSTLRINDSNKRREELRRIENSRLCAMRKEPRARWGD